MKVLILAGGLGTRISEETDVRPKPMVEIGGQPILWHIMKTYSQYGFNDFNDRAQINRKMAKRFFEKSMSNIKLNENIIQSLINSTPNNNSWKRDIKKDHDKYLSKLNKNRPTFQIF